MPDLSRVQAASRSAVLELQDELRLVNDGYEFLDQKRILLAAEMLRQQQDYAAARGKFAVLCDHAAGDLVHAAADQGFEGLQVFPATELSSVIVQTKPRSYIGQVLLEVRLVCGETSLTYKPIRPTRAVHSCRNSYREIILDAAELAARSSNLARLVREYKRTERRVRAIENVILPEIRQALAAMEEHLDHADQEEVIRVRNINKSSAKLGV